MQLVVGRIGKAHGIRGEVGVEVRTDDPDARFASGASLITEPADRGPLRVDATRWHSGRLLVNFAGVADRTAAEALRGTLLLVEVDESERPDDPDEFYDHQLVGLRVVSTAGDEVGEVADVLHLPAQDVLAIKRSDGAEVLVPFVKELVPVVDVDRGALTVDARPGLLDPEVADEG
jgi:16S rRNA processing protein RimM